MSGHGAGSLPGEGFGARGGALWLALLVGLGAGCASTRVGADSPPPSDPLAPAPARCSDGPEPIEILAADVVIAIDRSTSTRRPSGIDLDGDGVIGAFQSSAYTDRGDSMLAAQLLAVERLIAVTRLGGMRFAIVSWSGREDFPLDDSPSPWVDRRDARLEAGLTDDRAALEAAVARVERRGSDGATSFAPAMRLALLSFESKGALDERRRRVLFVSDSAAPVRFAPMNRIARDDVRMELEARRALESRVVFYSFGIGDAAHTDTAHALSQIAGATGGTYHPVPDPRQLYCQMLAALGASDPR